VILAVAVAVNVLFVAIVVGFMLRYKTGFFGYCRRHIRTADISGMMAADSEMTEQCRELREAKTIAAPSIEGNCLVITLEGHEPRRIDLDTFPAVRELFFDSSDCRISYNAFEVLHGCMKCFEGTGDERLVGLFWHTYREWRGSFRNRFLDDYSWFDHCVSGRFLTLRYAMLVLSTRQLLSESEYMELLREAIVTGDFLASDKQYDYITNHGLIVDRHLLEVAVTFPNIPEKHRWIARASARSLGRIDHYISDDGVPLEGSTSYWYMLYEYYLAIDSTCRRGQVETGQDVREKLERCREFLATVNINGKMNRLGNASGGHEFSAIAPRPEEEDGYYANVYDSGLVLFYGIREGKILSQLLFNVQDMRPYVHRHEDSLATVLYHDGVFWFNSPGTYSKDPSPTFRFVKSFRNQSIAYDAVKEYRHPCTIDSVEDDENGVSVGASVWAGQERLLQRVIRWDARRERLSIEDTAEGDGKVVSQYLLPPECRVEGEGQPLVRLIHGDAALDIEGDTAWECAEGKISYGRNQLADTTLLRMASAKNTMSFSLGNGLKGLTVRRSQHGYPYKKRVCYPKPLLSKMAQRIHERRLKQLGLAIAVELAAIALVQLLVWSY